MPTVVVSGAGIAGLSVAHWLDRAGYHVIVVEVAPGIRPGGQTVDLRGAGRTIVERMGLFAEMSARSLDQAGIAWVRSDGSRRAEMPVTAFHGNGMVSQLEILRGDIVDVLYQHTRERADYRFGTRITALVPDADGITVTLSDGTTVAAALVIGADGLHSAVRRLAFGPEEECVVPLGGYNAWFTAPDVAPVAGWFLTYQAAGGLNASMRPAREPGLCKAGFAFRSDPLDYDRHDSSAQVAILTEKFAGTGWFADEMLAAAAVAEDFYFDAFAQVHMDSFAKGRAALVGDAGYCASPLSGMGTSLALVGAYVLAGELGPADKVDAAGIDAAFTRYQAVMAPYIAKCQDLPKSVERFMPATERDIAIGAHVMNWMQRWPIRLLAERVWFTTADAVELPDY